jgi:hypothetical protein
MNYIFEINLYTDGDYSLPFVPCGMKYDGDYEYTFRKSYTDRDVAIKNIFSICSFLKENIHTSRDYIKKDWDNHIDHFITKLKTSNPSAPERVEEYMGGNYEGTEWVFKTEAQKIDCSFFVTDEEFEMIKKNDNHISRKDIKEAILSMFRKK